jgi:HPt (histidine-containing phosphotransfer) domain-containing protein
MTPAPEPLDRVYLGDIFEAGGEELAREVAGTFVSEAARRTQALRDALDRGDWSGAALAAHAIVSGSCMLGLTTVSEAARNVEHMAGAQSQPPAAVLTVLETVIRDAGPVLENAIAELAGQQGSVG